MKNRFFLLIALLALAVPAHARVGMRSADMFIDKNIAYERPAVPSDRGRGQDMLPTLPVFYNENADMFDHARIRFAAGRDDMFPFWTVATIPHHTLKMDPHRDVVETALYMYTSHD